MDDQCRYRHYRIHDLQAEERLQVAFGDVQANSDGLEREKTEQIDSQKKPEGQQEKAHLPPGFLDPLSVTLSHFSDRMERGDERYCAVCGAHTNSISLITIFLDLFTTTLLKWAKLKYKFSISI